MGWRADKSAVAAINRALRGYAARMGYPGSFVNVHHRVLQLRLQLDQQNAVLLITKAIFRHELPHE
jgi:hypothetical protein